MRHGSARKAAPQGGSWPADLPPCLDEVVRRESVDAAERLIKGGDHVDYKADERHQDAAEHEVRRPAEIEQPQHEDVQNRPDQDDGPDDRWDACRARLDARAAPL